MNKTIRTADVTYGQLSQVLRSLGFTYRPGIRTPPGHVYEHHKGAIIMLPAFKESDKIYEHHLIDARMELDGFGIADPATFERLLQKAA